MQHLTTGIVSFGALLLLMGASDTKEVRYACENNIQLSVTFSGDNATPGTAHLVIAGTPINLILPQVPSADGGRYAGNGVEFWIKGNSASLTRTGSDATTCHVR